MHAVQRASHLATFFLDAGCSRWVFLIDFYYLFPCNSPPFRPSPARSKTKDTGVRFADIAGMDHIVFEMREVVKLMQRDPTYVKVRGQNKKWSLYAGWVKICSTLPGGEAVLCLSVDIDLRHLAAPLQHAV